MQRSRFRQFLLPGTALLLSSCANPDLLQTLPAEHSLTTQRWWFLALAIGLLLIQTGLAIWLGHPFVIELATDNWPIALLSPFLLWTKLGEWGYLFLSYLVHHWPWVNLALNGILLGLLGGTGCLVMWVIQFSFVYSSPEIFYAVMRPALIGVGVHLAILLGLCLRKQFS